jgi:hypothetical protein
MDAASRGAARVIGALETSSQPSFDLTVTARPPDPGPIVEFFRARPALTAATLREHVDDGSGHCAGCRWWQSAIPTWPCPTVWYAQRAREAERPR